MRTTKPVIAANWKMHKTPQEGHQFARQLATKALNLGGVDFILAPAATALLHLQGLLKDTAIELCGQNMHFADAGAYTGEISAGMLVACGCRWVIIGHSERRHIFGESDDDLRRKVPAALSAGLGVIHCIGERLEEREAGRTVEVLRHQITNDLADLDTFPTGRIMIAYEPVWAIGTGQVATPEQAGEAHASVREIVRERFPGDETAVKVLYGGSVKSGNAADLIKTPGIDGFLIGGASLDINEYCRIAEIAQLEANS
jgi:triosephosphate isomerase